VKRCVVKSIKSCALAFTVGLGLVACLGQPASAQVSYHGAQMTVDGTVATVAQDVCTVQTPSGPVSVPLHATRFYRHGTQVSWRNLAAGDAVEAITQTTVTYVAPAPQLWVDWNEGLGPGAWDVQPYQGTGWQSNGHGWAGHAWNGAHATPGTAPPPSVQHAPTPATGTTAPGHGVDGPK
jgi:hypothetical protein